MSTFAVWSIERGDDLVAFSQSPNLISAWYDANDWLQTHIGIRWADLTDDERNLVITTFVNPTVVDIHGYTIKTELA